MAMTYTSLAAPKGTSGSIANWVAYTKLDLPPIIDEAQALIYETLRTREMLTQTTFRIPTGNSEAPLPARFLDPIGRIWVPTINRSIAHKDESYVTKNRVYTILSGSLGNNPFTTTNGSSLVLVNLPSHGFNQGAVFISAGATAVGGITPNGTFLIASITDQDDFVIDCSSVGTASSGTTGGGSGASYSCENLIANTPPTAWAIWDEKFKFDGAFNQDSTCQLPYFQSLPLLAAGTNESNFITNRYPQLMRTACQAQAADFMKDTEEYNKSLTRLAALIAKINVENEGFRHGSEIDMETP